MIKTSNQTLSAFDWPKQTNLCTLSMGKIIIVKQMFNQFATLLISIENAYCPTKYSPSKNFIKLTNLH